jgi:thiol-disulfide isomerase/thioredoxin
MHFESGTTRDIRVIENLIKKGPMLIMLVKTNTCPHCISYMPVWKELCKAKGRKANMVSMDVSAYNNTSLSQKKPVSGVPTVIYVNQAGEIMEAREPRNISVMTEAVTMSPGSESTMMNTSNSSASMRTSNFIPAAPMTSENPLKPLPGMVIPSEPMVQNGGNPWAAFLLAARQAAPAAALLGAYAALPAKRSSGLRAPRKTRRRNRRQT